MREVDPVGFIRRSPGGGVRVQRVPMWGVGPWNQLSVDGHDKLRAFGIYIYGRRDNFSGYVMHLYMGRLNRNPHIINRETIRMFMNYGTEEEGCIPVTIIYLLLLSMHPGIVICLLSVYSGRTELCEYNNFIYKIDSLVSVKLAVHSSQP